MKLPKEGKQPCIRLSLPYIIPEQLPCIELLLNRPKHKGIVKGHIHLPYLVPKGNAYRPFLPFQWGKPFLRLVFVLLILLLYI